MSEVAPQVDPGSDIAQTPPGGLLAGIRKEAAPITPVAEPIASNAEHWFWDDGVPGAGPRPAWLKDKYTNIAAQAKAYVEAEKQLGQLGSGPEEYKFEEDDAWDPTNPYMQKFMETAKKSRMPQEAFNDMLTTLADYEASKIPNKDAEIAKLGPEANSMIERVRRWTSTNLSQEACDLIGQIGNNAAVIKMFDEIRQLNIHQASQPPGSTGSSDNFVRLTQDDWNAELAIPANSKRYLEDAKYRAEMSRKLQIIHGEEV